MAEAVVGYDRELPEIPGRCPWERPASHLVKDDAAPTGWRVDEAGHRPSRLLLPPKIRAAGRVAGRRLRGRLRGRPAPVRVLVR